MLEYLLKTWDECKYWSRMALLNFPATIGCVRVLIDLPQEDFVALYIMGWTRVHSSITMRHIKVTLSILSTCVSRMIRCDVLYLCRFSLFHQPFITYCIVHIHFMVSFCWHVCLVFSGFDVLYSCTLSSPLSPVLIHSILFNHMSWFHCWHVCLLWSELDVLYPFGIILLIIYLHHPQHCRQFFMVHANGTSPTHVVDSSTLDIITWFTSKHI
jgi:hypothetical protein